MDANPENTFLDLRKFKIIKKLGNGSFGNVYKVQNTETQELYAAKTSKHRINKLKDDSNKILYLFREIKIMSSLNHPTIIQYIGYSPTDFEDSSKPTIITEYASNGSLKDLINYEKSSCSLDNWDLTHKLICIYGIASGMSYLHEHHIIHRDLKSENILVDEYLHPKISDFGLSKIVNGITESLRIQSQAGLKGTVLYMAPESFNSENFSESSDVYSFAMIVHELMNIENSFEQLNMMQIFEKLVKGLRPDISEIVPDAYRELIEKCWAQDPKDRPSFDEIVEELKTNHEFITDLVDENEFLQYVDFIESFKSSFDLSKQSIHMNDLITTKRKNFKKVKIQKNDKKNIKIVHVGETNDKIGFFQQEEYNNLSLNCQKLVKEAENNCSSQYLLSVYLIKGENEFPQNVEIGIKYLQKSKEGGCKESMIYLAKLFINGILISQNFEAAEEIIKKLNNLDKQAYYLLKGKLEEKKNNYQIAKDNYKKAIKLKNGEAMYCYGLLLTKGKDIKKNLKKANKYFELAKMNGFSIQEQIDQQDNNFDEFLFKSESDDDDDDENFKILNLPKKNKIKIVFVGDKGKGKLETTYYMIHGKLDRYIPCYIQNTPIKMQYHGSNCYFQFWDTTDQEDLENIRVLSYCNGDVFILVYSLIDKVSFQNIFDLWIPDVIKYVGKKGVFLLVGVNFEVWSKDPYNPKYVQQKDIDKSIKKIDFSSVIKCSYLTDQNMESLDLKKIADYFFQSKYPKQYQKIIKHKSKKVPVHDFKNNLKIQVYCVGNEQSGIHEFLNYIKKTQSEEDDNKEKKIEEDVEGEKIGEVINIAHIYQNKDVIFQFSQASFQDALHIIHSQKKSKTQVILLLFSLIHRESFLYLTQEWSNYIKEYKKNDIILLIGVDRDLWDENSHDFVHLDEIGVFAQNIGAFNFVKCSYITGNKIEYCKNQIIKAVISKK